MSVGVRAVVFDVGNTLAHLDYERLSVLFRNHGAGAAVDAQAVGREDARMRRSGWEPDGYFTTLARRLGLEGARAAAAARQAMRWHRQRPGGLWDQVDPDAAQVLADLARVGLALGVVSNADGRVEDQLRRLGLRRHFSVVVDSQRAGVEKPDPRIFGYALAELGVEPAAALYVGDIVEVDVRGAEAAGMLAVLYDRFDAWADAPLVRVRRLADLRDLPPLLPAFRCAPPDPPQAPPR